MYLEFIFEIHFVRSENHLTSDMMRAEFFMFVIIIKVTI